MPQTNIPVRFYTVYYQSGGQQHLATVLEARGSVEDGFTCDLSVLNCHGGRINHGYETNIPYSEDLKDGHYSFATNSNGVIVNKHIPAEMIAPTAPVTETVILTGDEPLPESLESFSDLKPGDNLDEFLTTQVPAEPAPTLTIVTDDLVAAETEQTTPTPVEDLPHQDRGE